MVIVWVRGSNMLRLMSCTAVSIIVDRMMMRL